jgi:hypothetical protein
VDDQGLYQLFFKDPVNDVKVELSYANAEAACRPAASRRAASRAPSRC